MCLCRSNGTGVVVRRRVIADARFPVAILLPVHPPTSPPPTLTIVVLCVSLLFTAVSCSTASVMDTAERTERTGNSERVDRLPEVSKTISGDCPTTINSGRVDASSSDEVRSRTTTEYVEKFTTVEKHFDGNGMFSKTPDSISVESQQVTDNSRQFRSSTHRDDKITETSPSSTSVNRELATDGPQSTAEVLDFWSKTTSTEDVMATMTTFDEETPVTEMSEVSSSATNVEVPLPAEVTRGREEWSSSSDVTVKLNGIGVDGFDEDVFTTSVVRESNTRQNDFSRRYTLPTTTDGRTTNRTTSRRGATKRCLQMRTGGGDIPATNCHQDSVVLDDQPSGTTDDRRQLEFCDAYSVYVADYDCAPSSSCLDFICPDVVRLDRMAQSMNDQFVEQILNYYDCKNGYSGVWNCSGCKVRTSYLIRIANLYFKDMSLARRGATRA